MPGNRALAKASVSIMRVADNVGLPMRPNSASRKAKSNGALCAIRLSSPKNSSSSSTISPKRGLPARSVRVKP